MAPSRMRLIVAALAVALIVIAVWRVIEYRQQAPPPEPIPAGATP